MVYKYAYFLNTLLLLHTTFILSVLKKNEDAAKTAEVGGHGMHWIVMEITLLIMENHGKIMELCF